MPASIDPKLINTVFLDVDGVLTDGRIGYSNNNDEEVKFFSIKDGCGIKLLRQAGIRVGIISGRRSRANARRAAELRLDFLVENCHHKDLGMSELMCRFGVKRENCLYMGDDLIDLPAMRQAGISVAVADAAPELISQADWVMTKCGGDGAVREMAEKLLKLQNRWQELLAQYVNPLKTN